MAGGIVLWSRSFTPEAQRVAASAASPVNSLVREALIEGRTGEEKYEKDGYAVKWTFVNDLELIFVVSASSVVHSWPLRTQLYLQVAYQRILQLTYVDDLLAALRDLFIRLFQPFLTTFVASLHAVNVGKVTAESAVSWNFAEVFANWDKVFDKLLSEVEGKGSKVSSYSVQCFPRLMNLPRIAN